MQSAQLDVGLVLGRRLLGLRQRGVEDLDDLFLRQLPAIILDQDRAGQWVRLVVVDAEHSHQLALDRLTEILLAVQPLVAQPDPPRHFVKNHPAREIGHAPRRRGRLS